MSNEIVKAPGYYLDVLGAARMGARHRFALAEALAHYIPLQPGKTGVAAALGAMRARIMRNEPTLRGLPQVATLVDYRLVALKFRKELPGNAWVYEWAPGFTLWDHIRAYKVGMSAEEFRAEPLTAATLRRLHSPKRAPVEKWPEGLRADAVTEPRPHIQACLEELSTVAKLVRERIAKYGDELDEFGILRTQVTGIIMTCSTLEAEAGVVMSEDFAYQARMADISSPQT